MMHGTYIVKLIYLVRYILLEVKH
jgi:hypothetical protein